MRGMIVAALLCAAGPASAGYSALYVFGDSLVDVGNVDVLTAAFGLPDPSPAAAGYAPGRFSNGPTFADVLADKLGVGPLAPSLVGGTGFAFGGALASSNGDFIPDLAAQVAAFAARGPADPNALVLVNAGGNDGFAILGGAPLAPATVGQAIADSIAALAGSGARTILVNNVVDLGVTPLVNGNEAAARAVSIAIDDAITAALDLLVLPAGTKLIRFDAFALSEAFAADPGAYGLPGLDLETQCVAAGLGPLCLNLNYMDAVHPTAVVHRVFGEQLFLAVPAPATLALFGLSLGGLAWARRRR